MRMRERGLKTRAWLFVTYLSLIYLGYSWAAIGELWRPTGGGMDLWFISVMGLVAIRLIDSPFFRKPTDSFLAALAAAFALWATNLNAIDGQPLLTTVRWAAIGYLGVVACTSLVSITLLTSDESRPVLRKIFYRFSTRLGAPELLFTPAVLISVIGFHDLASAEGIGLAALWFLLAVTRPLEEVVGIAAFRSRTPALDPNQRVGTISRIDAPNLIRVELDRPNAWEADAVLTARLSTGDQMLVLPLFLQAREGSVLGTGLLCGAAAARTPKLPFESVWQLDDCPDRGTVMAGLVGEEDSSASLVGFVVEGSTINRIHFEVALDGKLREGEVVFCRLAGGSVYYQIVGAETAEETFNQNPRGMLRVTAAQLGSPSTGGDFTWHPWVPTMNTPVFRPVVAPGMPERVRSDQRDLLDFAVVPGTEFPGQIDFKKLSEFHGAVLGVTGMGKTELVFDVIREGLRRQAKILCVDFTGEYRERLAENDPVELGLSDGRVSQLEDLVNAVETGAYSGADEKRELNAFLRSVHPEIADEVDRFLTPEGAGLAIFELDDIANTRATLRATELYLSEIFRWAKGHRRAREILLVLEEAHTIIPEFNLFGFDRNDTAAVVGRMSQIALQGRKYGVGILLVSQRTALVSKTVLSQCNTYFCFSLVDKTSLEYMGNVFGTDHLTVIPNLGPRQLVAYGPGVGSEKPVILEIPFDESKARASASLDVELVSPADVGIAPEAEREENGENTWDPGVD